MARKIVKGRGRVRRVDAAPPATPTRARRDGWENLLTGLGTTRDKRLAAQVAYQKLSYVECEDLWRGDDMGAKIVEEPAREMVRRWLDVEVENDPDEDVGETKDQSEGAESELKRLKARARVREAVMRQRAFGGAVILLGADDGVSDPSMPLAEENLRSIKFLTVFDAWEVYPRSYYEDVMEEKYGQPETYWVYPQGIAGGLPGRRAGKPLEPREGQTTVMHESRMLRFEGVHVSRRQARENRGWGDSVFVRIQEVLQDFGTSWGSSAHLLQDFAQAVFKMRGLREALAGNQKDLVKARLEAMEMARSVLRATLLDAGDGQGASEEFERKQTPVTGLPELLDRWCNRLAAAADMPVTRLMGQSPAGLNATGATDAQWWYDRIEGLQEEVLLEPVTRLVKLIFRAEEGPTKGAEPKNWSIKFRPIRQLSAMEEADRRLKVAQADDVYLKNQAVTPEEVAVSRFGGDDFSGETHIDKELRAKWAEEREEEPAPGIAPPAAPAPGNGAPPAGGLKAPPAAKPPPGKRPPATNA